MPGCSMKGTYATKINQDKKPQQRQAVHASWAFLLQTPNIDV